MNSCDVDVSGQQGAEHTIITDYRHPTPETQKAVTKNIHRIEKKLLGHCSRCLSRAATDDPARLEGEAHSAPKPSSGFCLCEIVKYTGCHKKI